MRVFLRVRERLFPKSSSFEGGSLSMSIAQSDREPSKSCISMVVLATFSVFFVIVFVCHCDLWAREFGSWTITS